MYDQWCEELEVPLKRCGSLVVAFNEEEEKELKKLYDRGIENGVPGMELVSGARARELEPQLSQDVTAALWAATGGICCHRLRRKREGQRRGDHCGRARDRH